MAELTDTHAHLDGEPYAGDLSEVLARAAAAGTLDDNGWATLKRSALEMIERLVAHIQKETMGLLPLLDDLLDEGSDRELAFAYAGG